ncbi:uncharacterized protein B4U79_05994, partial [Dinothrombium tinctorium]
IWGTLTHSEKTSTCPGECIHAITSIFCDHVLEEVTCGPNYLRCCVPSDLSYGTPVETSPPLGDEEENISNATSSSALKLLTTANATQSISSTFISSTETPGTQTSQASTQTTPLFIDNISSTSAISIHCPGVCVKIQYARYCGNIMSNGRCVNEGEACCLQSEIDSTNNTKHVFAAFNNQTENGKKAENIESNDEIKFTKNEISTESNILESSTNSLPNCEGTCVTPIFSLLCDRIDDTKYCPNEGSCCVETEDSTIASTSTTTTLAPTPTPCAGRCIPIILSGVCVRPAELIFKTSTCMSGTVCCQTASSAQNEARPEHISIKPTGPSKHATPPSLVFIPQPFPPPPPLPNIPQHASNSKIPPNVHVFQRPKIPSNFPVQSPTSLLSSYPTPTPINANRPPQETFEKVKISSSDAPKDVSTETNPVIQPTPGGPPFCPGLCISPLIRFTCFGGNAIYPKFQCTKQGQHLHPYICGVKGTHRRQSPRIVGGLDALPGEWCWQVALINSQNQYLCGGALIGAQWVLTAAHCITSLVRNAEPIYIRVGDYDLTAKYTSPRAQTLKVSTTYIHHNHNTQTLDNDIALLKMEFPVELSESICLVCLPARGTNAKAGKKCTVTGYGYTSESGPIALKVREAEVPIVDDQECSVKINVVTEKLFILPTSSFCAGGEAGNDACQGDGGGPLVCEVDGYYELTGLVSWGFGCGRQNVPGVYVKVSNFIGWINQIISVNNQ